LFFKEDIIMRVALGILELGVLLVPNTVITWIFIFLIDRDTQGIHRFSLTYASDTAVITHQGLKDSARQ
jgi:hypothetical protein